MRVIEEKKRGKENGDFRVVASGRGNSKAGDSRTQSQPS